MPFLPFGKKRSIPAIGTDISPPEPPPQVIHQGETIDREIRNAAASLQAALHDAVTYSGYRKENLDKVTLVFTSDDPTQLQDLAARLQKQIDDHSGAGSHAVVTYDDSHVVLEGTSLTVLKIEKNLVAQLTVVPATPAAIPTPNYERDYPILQKQIHDRYATALVTLGAVREGEGVAVSGTPIQITQSNQRVTVTSEPNVAVTTLQDALVQAVAAQAPGTPWNATIETNERGFTIIGPGLSILDLLKESLQAIAARRTAEKSVADVQQGLQANEENALAV